MSLSGQKIVVIGGTSGMGRAVAELAVGQCADVVIAGRDADRSAKVAEEIGGGATGAVCDLSDPASIQDLADTVGALDHLVLSAASLVYGPFTELSVDDARGVMDGKFWGYWNAARAFEPRLPEAGSITMFSGVAAVRPDQGTAIVTAVNAAVEGLTRSLAVELAPRRVNAVSPGVVESPSWAHLSVEDRTAMFEQVAGSLPVGRVGQPEDVAKAVLELADNGYSTGEVRTVDGGARLV